MFSQSTFFLDEDEQPVLIYQSDTVHGFGIEPVYSYSAEEEFEDACQKALDELNSNLFMSVYIEEFQTNDYSTYNFPELSIRDTVLTFGDGIVKKDSVIIDEQAVCVVGTTNYADPINVKIPSLSELFVAPQKIGNTWFAVGKTRATSYNPSLAWMKAKNNALQDLTKAIRISVQSIERQLEEGDYTQSGGITYFKSNLIYNGIYNVRRYTTHKSFLTVIAVKESDVIEY
ncbi:MAG: hypothetical protein JJ953_07625 [Gracilimonas sp.]|uniref:hypothetical protein n=1 Tax=Gracilimonas sp. TaxID=1974203 RepID=UPI001B0E24C8|nr:hypothetical protein [Gracilimonas sp.]MBO6585954.1 hypothetical protein [Gracilimonas sp.]MBO6616951.1 hypothetical protein [Gracilimonas sp.]